MFWHIRIKVLRELPNSCFKLKINKFSKKVKNRQYVPPFQEFLAGDTAPFLQLRRERFWRKAAGKGRFLWEGCRDSVFLRVFGGRNGFSGITWSAREMREYFPLSVLGQAGVFHVQEHVFFCCHVRLS